MSTISLSEQCILNSAKEVVNKAKNKRELERAYICITGLANRARRIPELDALCREVEKTIGEKK